ncbi:MAG TPA: hypothetical protein VGS41_08560 [Chthonomonadales bacterium]|nr:hypothetical protein [Chthonomonadales bacterium]
MTALVQESDKAAAQAKAIQILTDADTSEVIEYLAGQKSAVEVAEIYHAMMKDAYWKRKRLDHTIILARAGIHQSIVSALPQQQEDPETAARLLGIAKAINYDLASFTWVGWDEPGIEISTIDAAIGMDAARANLRFAMELEKGDLAVFRAYWMLGAHLLTAGDRVAAGAAFASAARHAATAETETGVMLSRGFAILATAPQQERERELEPIIEKLSTLEQGPGYIDQIKTAIRVLYRV